MAKGPGRNALCPCGSGRKYKNCCLAADEANAREARGEQGAPPVVSLPPPIVDAVEELPNAEFPVPDDEQSDLWDAFEAADYEAQIEIFQAALAAGELDSELA